jgi:acyl carrier protein
MVEREVVSMDDPDGVLAALQSAARDVLGDDAPVLTPAARLGDDGLGVESLDLIEIVMVLEERYDLRLEPSVLRDVRTVGDLIDLILAATTLQAGS